jgi:excisionase family DNA binding protein
MLMTPKEAAERARVSVSLIYQWCNSGQLAHLRVGMQGRRGKILIVQADLESFLATLKSLPMPREQVSRSVSSKKSHRQNLKHINVK